MTRIKLRKKNILIEKVKQFVNDEEMEENIFQLNSIKLFLASDQISIN